MPSDTKWGESFVTWKGFISIIMTMIIAGASLFGYVLSIHANSLYLHTTNIRETTEQNIRVMENRVSRLDERNSDRLERIEDKIDSLLKTTK